MDKDARMQTGEWILRSRSRTGNTWSVHYGTQSEIAWYAHAALRRVDEIEEHRPISPPTENQLQ